MGAYVSESGCTTGSSGGDLGLVGETYSNLEYQKGKSTWQAGAEKDNISNTTIVRTALHNEWLEAQGVPSLVEIWKSIRYPEQETLMHRI